MPYDGHDDGAPAIEGCTPIVSLMPSAITIAASFLSCMNFTPTDDGQAIRLSAEISFTLILAYQAMNIRAILWQMAYDKDGTQYRRAI